MNEKRITQKIPANKITILSQFCKKRNSYFLHWNFDWKSCFVVFFLEWNEWNNLQFNFSSQNLSIERNFFKWDGKETKILHLLFHRIWKILHFTVHFTIPRIMLSWISIHYIETVYGIKNSISRFVITKFGCIYNVQFYYLFFLV